MSAVFVVISSVCENLMDLDMKFGHGKGVVIACKLVMGKRRLLCQMM